MSCHYHIGLLTYGRIGNKLKLFELIIAFVYKRKPCVAVGSCITVAGEVLAGSDNSHTLQPLYVAYTHFADKIGV